MPRMNVAIDARALHEGRTGIGVYTEAMVRGLAGLPGVGVTLFSPRAIPGAALLPARVEAPSGGPRWGTVWVQTSLARAVGRADCDVLLSAVTIAPARSSVPTVPVVHDLTPLTHPQWHRPKTVTAFVPWIEKTLERAARIIAVSHATAEELRRRYPEIRSRISVVPHGVDPRFSPDAPEGERERARSAWAGGRPYLLFLGTLEPRKNLRTLVAACEELWQRRPSTPDLVLAGGPGWKSRPLLEAISRSPFRERIHLPGYVRDEDAPSLLRSAEVFCYPSLAEGFGLPVLEAMACGTPVVISDAPGLREVAGDAASPVPAEDPPALAAAIERLLDDDAWRSEAVGCGRDRARAHSWEDAAEKTASILREACGAGPA